MRFYFGLLVLYNCNVQIDCDSGKSKHNDNMLKNAVINSRKFLTDVAFPEAVDTCKEIGLINKITILLSHMIN